MRLPDGRSFQVVYQCSAGTHEYTETVDTYAKIDMFAFQDPEPCSKCSEESGRMSGVSVDRIEVVK